MAEVSATSRDARDHPIRGSHARPAVGVTDAGAAADADAIGGGADDIGRDPVVVTTDDMSILCGRP
jgi:hypothetical protein